jgi:hypothetical protein
MGDLVYIYVHISVAVCAIKYASIFKINTIGAQTHIHTYTIKNV